MHVCIGVSQNRGSSKCKYCWILKSIGCNTNMLQFWMICGTTIFGNLHICVYTVCIYIYYILYIVTYIYIYHITIYIYVII